jgi:hypothetical protein
MLVHLPRQLLDVVSRNIARNQCHPLGSSAKKRLKSRVAAALQGVKSRLDQTKSCPMGLLRRQLLFERGCCTERALGSAMIVTSKGPLSGNTPAKVGAWVFAAALRSLRTPDEACQTSRQLRNGRPRESRQPVVGTDDLGVVASFKRNVARL